jgi:hypothetical protein
MWLFQSRFTGTVYFREWLSNIPTTIYLNTWTFLRNVKDGYFCIAAHHTAALLHYDTKFPLRFPRKQRTDRLMGRLGMLACFQLPR